MNPYRWFWQVFLCRLEPFSHEWRRHLMHWSWVYVIAAGGLGAFLMWLILHLGGFL